jgi:hypothetical protein
MYNIVWLPSSSFNNDILILMMSFLFLDVVSISGWRFWREKISDFAPVAISFLPSFLFGFKTFRCKFAKQPFEIFYLVPNFNHSCQETTLQFHLLGHNWLTD